jgi:flagellar M-ring protein FliF
MGYELFDKTNLGMSEFVQQLNGRRALEGELQRTIRSNPELKDVKVHLNIPKRPLLKSMETPPTAAVTLKFKNNHSYGKVNILGIQQLIAQSVEGMTPDKVVVTDNFGRILSEEIPDPSTLAGITSSQFKQQKQKEKYLTEKVQQLLDPVYGMGNSKVRLNVEMDFDQLEVNKTDYDPERQVERSEQINVDELTDVDTSFVPGTNLNHLRPLRVYWIK